MFDDIMQSAMDALAQSNVSTAIEILGIARSIAPDDFERAHVDDLMALYLVRTHRNLLALDHLEMAAVGYAAAGVQRLAATCRETMGDVLVDIKRVDEAIVAYKKAAAFYRVDGLLVAEAGCNAKLAKLLMTHGRSTEGGLRLDDAIETYENRGWTEQANDLDRFANSVRYSRN